MVGLRSACCRYVGPLLNDNTTYLHADNYKFSKADLIYISYSFIYLYGCENLSALNLLMELTPIGRGEIQLSF